MIEEGKLKEFLEKYPNNMNFSADFLKCRKCDAVVKAFSSTEIRVMKGLTKTYGILYSVHRCTCGNSFCSYPEETYPAGDTYLPEVKERIRNLRDIKKLGYTEIKNRMKRELIDVFKKPAV